MNFWQKAKENKILKNILIFLGLLGPGIITGSVDNDAGGISKYISVPLTAGAVWILVTKGNYKISERIFLMFSVCLLSYVVSAVAAKPDWSQVGGAFIHPQIHYDKAYLILVLGIIGTTIAPWMQFYMQSAVIEKGTTMDDDKFALADVVIGCVAT